jgi:hydroxymethylpyrimidine pyrophosphatase-like HAD family hydrolase
VLAVGDNDNDAPMLAWAGVGVALDNASPAARAAADWIAPSVEADGAAAALEHYGLA